MQNVSSELVDRLYDECMTNCRRDGDVIQAAIDFVTEFCDDEIDFEIIKLEVFNMYDAFIMDM